MSSSECSICKITYNRNNNKPIMLECGDSLCSSCIKSYKEAYKKEEFKCEQCCSITKSTNKENKALYPKDDTSSTSSKMSPPAQGEFEVFIKLLTGEKVSVRVRKEMTIDQLKTKVTQLKGINKAGFFLNFKKPLNNQKTLAFYNITRTVTINQSTYESGGLKNKII